MTQTIPIGWINTNDMKDQFLKIAGVKNENEFYKKFPTEESFMKVHGKALKKAQMGAMIQGDASPQFNPQPINFHKLYDTNDMLITGSTQEMRDKKELAEASVAAQQKMANNRSIGAITDIGNILGNTSKAKTGKKLNKAKIGDVVDKFGGPVTVAQSIGEVIGGAQQMKDEKQRMLGAQQMLGVSDIALQASMTRPEQVRKQYIRPEDNINTGEEFFPIYGVGTTIARNGTEIANNFSPYTIYDNLEEAQNGGMFANFGNQDFMRFNKAGEETGVYNFASQGGGNALSNLTAGIGNPKGYGTSGAGRIGGAIGGTAGMLIGGPVGAMVGKVGGQMIGNLVDRKAEKTEKALGDIDKNIAKMTLAQGAQSLQRQNYAYMENGGELSNLAFGGDLETHWGGYAEPISYNPYLPDGGETIMFRGQSHDDRDGYGNTGIGITYGENPVEVERGEPAIQLRDGSDGSSNLTVYGNLQIPSFGAEMIGDKKAKGKKFKNYIADLSKTEKKQNKIMESAVNGIDDLEIITPFDSLEMSSYKANMLGANMKLKEIADKKIKASSLQSAINNTAEEYGLVADDLAKGKVKKAKEGAYIKKAQGGVNQPKYKTIGVSPGSIDYNPIGIDPEKWRTEGAYMKDWVSEVDQILSDPTNVSQIILEAENYTGQDQEDVRRAIAKGRTRQEKLDIIKRLATDKKIGPYHEMVKKYSRPIASPQRPSLPEVEFDKPVSIYRPETVSETVEEGTPTEKFDWMNVANQILPYVRPTNAQRLDPRQLAGEMYALSTNQVMPVDAQLFQPELDVPYDISLQDIINQNQADYRAAQRMIGYNPAAQANLNAQKYQANQQVLGEQFRMNQAMKDRVYSQNRNILNDAKLRNLDILDKQFARQQEALSNTKATTQSALNSIAAKYAQNQLENRTLQTYENLYNYRFDPRFRAMNMNPLAQFSSDLASLPSKDLEEALKAKKEEKRKSDKPEESRNGSIVKAIKSMR